MKTSSKGIELIKKFEGCRKKAYLDMTGVPTIGYGHTKNVKLGDKLSLQACEELLKIDLIDYENAINRFIDKGYRFNQYQFDALVSFAFNLGIGNLIKLLSGRRNSYTAIARAMPKYCHARVNGRMVIVKGLLKRRKEEVELFNTPIENVSRETFLSLDDIVNNTINGKYGNGKERKRNIENLGFNYAIVQKEVNRRLRKK